MFPLIQRRDDNVICFKYIKVQVVKGLSFSKTDKDNIFRL